MAWFWHIYCAIGLHLYSQPLSQWLNVHNYSTLSFMITGLRDLKFWRLQQYGMLWNTNKYTFLQTILMLCIEYTWGMLLLPVKSDVIAFTLKYCCDYAADIAWSFAYTSYTLELLVLFAFDKYLWRYWVFVSNIQSSIW